MLKRFADNTNSRSLASQFRQRRFTLFQNLLLNLHEGLSILDVGGTRYYWSLIGVEPLGKYSITTLNIHRETISLGKFQQVIGDARRMAFASKSFDVIYSNSIIEHIGRFEDQTRMANEVRRVGKRYFLQTPNRWFPIEPHFLFPFFQFLPVSIRVFLLRNFPLGWIGKIPDAKRAREIVKSIRLLDRKELRELFPGAHFYEEKFFGLTKSFVVYDGWD